MASNLHHYHHCICHSSAAAAVPTVCYCCSVPVPHHPPPPDLHSIPPCFNNPQQQPHLFDPCPNSPYNTQCRHPHPLHQTGQPYVQELHHQRLDPQPVFSSLLRRIASLESSLRRRRSISSHSLRDTAARTIQTHFRAFLVRRSRTLSHLKELASIKSALNTLKSSASNIDPQAVCHKAKNLLLQLGAIQDSDPMIRDGKNSITRELVKLIELIDVESYSLSSRIVKNVKHGCAKNKSRVHVLQEMENMESIINKYLELRKSVEEEEEEEDEEFESPRVSVVKKSGVLRKGGLGKRNGGVNSKVNKGVSFAEDGNIFRYPQVNLKPVSDREGDSVDGEVTVDGNEELIENLCRRVEDLGVSLKDVEVDEEAQLEDGGGSRGSSDAETEPNYSSRKEDKFGIRLDQGDNGTFVFSAPLPVKMEGRAGFANRHKTVRFAD